MHVKELGEEVFAEHSCGGFIEDTVRKHGVEILHSLSVPQRNPGKCICTGTRADHSVSDGLLRAPSQTSRTWETSSHPPIPGPSRPLVNSTPITNIFSPTRPLGQTVNERREVSTLRATTRNRGGIPGIPPSPSFSARAVRGGQARTNSLIRQQETSKLTIFFLPFHVRRPALPCVAI
jgi:hypothetical protein